MELTSWFLILHLIGTSESISKLSNNSKFQHFFVKSVSGLANPHAKRLYDDLLSNYNRLIRPVSNNTDKLTVKLGLKLSQLIDVVSFAGENV